MHFTSNPKWQNENLKCHFCGESKNVKYKTNVIVIDTIPVNNEGMKTEVCICSKCASNIIGFMTRNDMITFIKNNPYIHITHNLFAEDEYIYSDPNGIVHDESGYIFENWDSVTNMWSGYNGIRLRIGGMWENGWYIK